MTSKLTREERVKALYDLKVGQVISQADIENVKMLSRMALAAMDSEPVAWIWQHLKQWRVTNDEERARDLAWDGVKVEPLYRHAQPAPVVMDDRKLRALFDSWFASDCSFDRSPEASEEDNIAWRESYWYVWQRCRAAMLQAGTLTNEDTKQAWTGIPDIDNAINMLDRIDTLESCDDDRIEAVKTVLRRLAGNSPVIPDGYVMVPKEPTKAMILSAMRDNETGEVAEIYDLMLAAAPHDTPALNSLQSVDSVAGKWIPVSERIPEEGGRYWCYVEEQNSLGKSHYQWNCSWNGEIWGGAMMYGRVTHWMPLPAAPQEVQGES